MTQQLILRILLFILCTGGMYCSNTHAQRPIKSPTQPPVPPTPKPEQKKKSEPKRVQKQPEQKKKDLEPKRIKTLEQQGPTTNTQSQLSESAKFLAGLLAFPMAEFLDINMLDKNIPFTTIASAIKKEYSVDDGDDIWVWARKNPKINCSYHGLPFYCFYMGKDLTWSWFRDYQYKFRIIKQDMEHGLYNYLDLIVKDFNEIGIPITYTKNNDTYTKAKGSFRADDIEIILEYNKYGPSHEISIKLYIY